MKTLADIADKFSQQIATMRCIRKSKHGCGERKPLTEFHAHRRRRSDGTYRVEHDSRCAACESIFQRAKGVRRREEERKRQERHSQKHTGPARGSISWLWHCQLPPPPMSLDLREARRAR